MIALDSPFDFAEQARMWVPEHLPEPNDRGHSAAVAELCLRIVAASRGGVFVLCTSRRAVMEIAEGLRARLQQRLFVQGDRGSKAQLLQQFADDGNAVLVATSSFWEGVDVSGQALRVVMIDRVPFAPIGDPVFEARRSAIEAEGRNAFSEYQVPAAIMTLRQGAGRLIRDVSDRGLLVLCDTRLRTKGYGRRVLRSLPPIPLVDDEAEALTWAASL